MTSAAIQASLTSTVLVARAMGLSGHRRAIVGSALVAGTITCVGFVACRRPLPPPPPPLSNGPPQTTAPVVASTATTATQSGNGAADAAPDPEVLFAQEVASARTCSDPVTQILNHPDGGVVFNNAMTSVDAGFIDRTQGVLDALAASASQFRCCFDAYLRANPTEQGRVMLRVVLTGNGKVKGVEVDPTRSTVADRLTSACLVAVANDATYPVSPTGEQTIVEYPFFVGSK